MPKSTPSPVIEGLLEMRAAHHIEPDRVCRIKVDVRGKIAENIVGGLHHVNRHAAYKRASP
jgi:hypothetical protein